MEFVSDIDEIGKEHYYLKFKDNEYFHNAENGTDVEVRPTTETAQRLEQNIAYLRDYKTGDTKEEILQGLNNWLNDSPEGKELQRMYNAGYIRSNTVRDQDVLLLLKEDKNDPDVKSFEIVTGQNEDGTPKTIVPESADDFKNNQQTKRQMEDFMSDLVEKQGSKHRTYHFFRVPEYLLSNDTPQLVKGWEHEINYNDENAMCWDYSILARDQIQQKQSQEQSQDSLQVQSTVPNQVNEEDKILLVHDSETGKLGIVVGQNEDGTPKTIPALPEESTKAAKVEDEVPTKTPEVKKKEEEDPAFLKINKHENVFQSFMSNYRRQVENPTRFTYFTAPVVKVVEVAQQLTTALKNPETEANKAVLDTYRVEPATVLQKQTPIAEDRIDWSQLKQLGVDRETLVKNGALDAMLNWQKSPTLIPIAAKIDDVTIKTDARLSLRENPDGKLSVVIHAIRKKPELDRPYFGVKFTEEDKQNLLKTGNLGRVANIQYKQGENTPVFISIDKLTNELVAVRADRIKIPESVKGVQLDNKQKQSLAEGKSVLVEGIANKNGKKTSAHVQVNADKGGFELKADNSKKQDQSQMQTNGVRIPKTFLGVELNEKQQTDLKSNQTVYVAGLKDKQGQDFNAYVKVNTEKGKLDFFKHDPSKVKEQATKITPDNASKTQVAVNSEGKTNEATKSVKNEPLQAGQTQPTEKQNTKIQEKQKQEAPKKSKSKGIKM